MSVTAEPAPAVSPLTDTTVPDVVSPPPGHPRFPLMDSLRALAAFGVVLAHVSIFTGRAQQSSWGAVPANLSVGVTVFFVLSGFLLYRPFFNSELTAAPRPRLWEFTRRRLLRIVPAYWLALTVLAVYPGLPGVFSSDWWRYYGFLQFYNVHASRHGGLGIAWTLCVEVAFYVALPLYVVATRRVTRGRNAAERVRFQLAVLALLATASIILRVLDQGIVMQNSLLTHFYWFALGMALAVLSTVSRTGRALPRPLERLAAAPGLCWGSAVAAYLIMCAVLTSAPQHLQYGVAQAFWQHVLSGVVAVLIVIPAVFGERAGGLPRRVLGWRWLIWFGTISYGVYLWHSTVALTLIAHGVRSPWALLVTDLAVTTACAAASYYLVERPLLRLKNGRAGRQSSPTEKGPWLPARTGASAP